MNNSYGLELKPPVKKEKVKEVEKELGVIFPKDYVEFITYSNGAEGNIGENHVIIWSIEDIVELNDAYGVQDFAKELILFGTDGGDTAFAFDTRTNEKQIVTVPFICIDLDEITTCSNTFNGFLKHLLNS